MSIGTILDKPRKLQLGMHKLLMGVLSLGMGRTEKHPGLMVLRNGDAFHEHPEDQRGKCYEMPVCDHDRARCTRARFLDEHGKAEGYPTRIAKGK